MDKVEQLTELGLLLKDKTITQEEFDTLKKEVMSSSSDVSLDEESESEPPDWVERNKKRLEEIRKKVPMMVQEKEIIKKGTIQKVSDIAKNTTTTAKR